MAEPAPGSALFRVFIDAMCLNPTLESRFAGGACSTNAIGSLNAMLRAGVWAGGHFPVNKPPEVAVLVTRAP